MYAAVEYPGGIFNKSFNDLVAKMLPMLDNLATPVDSDPDGVLLVQARQSRVLANNSQNAIETMVQCPFRDSANQNGVNPWETGDLYSLVGQINQSHTAIYMTVGWYDLFTADMFYWYNSLSVPRRLTVRPTDHSEVSSSLADLDYGTEALRWFDYWLKGIHNGIMDEAPIHYYVQDGPKKGSWQTSDQWPLAAQKLTTYYFGSGKSGSVTSVNDGSLVKDSPSVASAADSYTVDYTTTTGAKTRWQAVEEARDYPDLKAHDSRALTYTTPPLQTDVNVTGHPVMHLWLTTDAPDMDVFVYLEEIGTSGKSTYLTEGDLRASHRKLSLAPFNNLGLPYNSHLQTDQQLVPAGEPFDLTFSLLPTSYQFHAGSRIRITVAFADAGNFDTPVLTPAPKLQILRDTDHPSHVEIPVIQDP
jgi:putative CocE/NonD family hydrolase